MKIKLSFCASCSLILFLGLVPSSLFAQGNLTPSGPPGPTMKTLDQAEPRVPIASAGLVISSSGSFYLTGNLTSPAAHGITVQADDVTIDLNGFALIGTGANSGILVNGVRTNIVVRNGTIRNWTTGVNAATGVRCRFEQLRVERNAGIGIDGGTNAVVDRCVVSLGTTGIKVLSGSLVQDCKVEKSGTGIDAGSETIISDCVVRSGNGGIAAGNSSLVKNCIATQTGNFGIAVTSYSSIINCVATGNGTAGLQLSSGNTVKDCTVQNNGITGISCFDNNTIIGCLVSGNGFGGIAARNGCIIKDCNVWNNNTGNGITAWNQSTISDCMVSQNTGGHGILVSNVCVIARCNSSLNERNQLEFGSYCQVMDNNFILNTNGASSSFYDLYARGDHNYIQGNNGSHLGGLGVVGKTNIIVKNFSLLNLSNTNNYFAPVVTTFGSLTNGVNPWANFQP